MNYINTNLKIKTVPSKTILILDRTPRMTFMDIKKLEILI